MILQRAVLVWGVISLGFSLLTPCPESGPACPRWCGGGFLADIWNVGGRVGSYPHGHFGMKGPVCVTGFVTFWPMTLGKSFNFGGSHFHHLQSEIMTLSSQGHCEDRMLSESLLVGACSEQGGPCARTRPQRAWPLTSGFSPSFRGSQHEVQPV